MDNKNNVVQEMIEFEYVEVPYTKEELTSILFDGNSTLDTYLLFEEHKYLNSSSEERKEKIFEELFGGMYADGSTLQYAIAGSTIQYTIAGFVMYGNGYAFVVRVKMDLSDLKLEFESSSKFETLNINANTYKCLVNPYSCSEAMLLTEGGVLRLNCYVKIRVTDLYQFTYEELLDEISNKVADEVILDDFVMTPEAVTSDSEYFIYHVSVNVVEINE